ncbi:MAG: tRNA dihydrouridine synthase DusB, partial [Azovibrio sp.]|nr:tRNA dihydrouridine synthase DusB [Azovibrio sp.]
IGWYVQALPGGAALRRLINTLDDAAAQLAAVNDYLDELAACHPFLPPPAAAAAPMPQSAAALAA